MSHYDCDNCGAYNGVDYGYCDQCTPKEVLLAKRVYEDAFRLADKKFEDLIENKRQLYIEKQTKALKETFIDLLEKHRPKK
jgi:hypothetical protein